VVEKDEQVLADACFKSVAAHKCKFGLGVQSIPKGLDRHRINIFPNIFDLKAICVIYALFRSYRIVVMLCFADFNQPLFLMFEFLEDDQKVRHEFLMTEKP
jgi:hypothetical protein